MAATKTKRTTKSKRTTKRTRRRKSKGIDRAVGSHPFAPGAKVGVWENANVAGTRGEPAPKAIATATVAKDGSLEVNVPKAGNYVVGGEVESDQGLTTYRRVSVVVT